MSRPTASSSSSLGSWLAGWKTGWCPKLLPPKWWAKTSKGNVEISWKEKRLISGPLEVRQEGRKIKGMSGMSQNKTTHSGS